MPEYAPEPHSPEIQMQIDCAFRLGNALNDQNNDTVDKPYLCAISDKWGETTVEKLPPSNETYRALYSIDSQNSALSFWFTDSNFKLLCDDSLNPRAIEFVDDDDEISVILAQDMNPNHLKNITKAAVEMVYDVLEINSCD